MIDRVDEVRLHMLVLDGVYCREAEGRLKLVPVPAPSTAELKRLVQRMAERVGRSLERSGLITRDIENAYRAFDPGEEPSIHGLLGHSITYRIATGPREGQKVFTLQTIPASPERPRREVAEASGFSLHAGIAAQGSQRDKLEHVARYVARPPVAAERLSLTEGRHVRYALKTPYRDGTAHVIFEPEDCKGGGRRMGAEAPEARATKRPETERRRALTWAARLKRVFAIDIRSCRRCGGTLRVIASLEESAVISRILAHLGGERLTADPRAGLCSVGATGADAIRFWTGRGDSGARNRGEIRLTASDPASADRLDPSPTRLRGAW